MKKLLLIFCLLFSVSLCYSQSGMSFSCGGYEFTVYEDDTPLEFSMKSGDDIRYSYGKVSQIGDISIRYKYGKVSQIGNVSIRYKYGKLSQIGGMSIRYSYGKLSGTSGSIGCDW